MLAGGIPVVMVPGYGHVVCVAVMQQQKPDTASILQFGFWPVHP
jgi:hypothetical protein